MIKTSCRGFLIMGSQWGRDGYYRKARIEGYRSRAAYKLLDIQERFQVIRDDDNVIDLDAPRGAGSRCSANSPTDRW